MSAVAQIDKYAAEQLLPLIYERLHSLAARRLAREKPGQTLQATALVHEAYLRLVDSNNVQHWDNSRHFFAAAAEAMRRILIENARRKRATKHGGHCQRIQLQDDIESRVDANAPDLLDLDQALTKLGAEDPLKAELVKLRYFAGLSVQEAADALEISRATADRYWSYARTWLYCELCGSEKTQEKLSAARGAPAGHFA